MRAVLVLHQLVMIVRASEGVVVFPVEQVSAHGAVKRLDVPVLLGPASTARASMPRSASQLPRFRRRTRGRGRCGSGVAGRTRETPARALLGRGGWAIRGAIVLEVHRPRNDSAWAPTSSSTVAGSPRPPTSATSDHTTCSPCLRRRMRWRPSSSDTSEAVPATRMPRACRPEGESGTRHHRGITSTPFGGIS